MGYTASSSQHGGFNRLEIQDHNLRFGLALAPSPAEVKSRENEPMIKQGSFALLITLMETHRDDVSKRAFTGPCCSLHPDALTLKAAGTAVARVEQALSGGRLLSPSEALVLAGKIAREKETLFSIARAVAWETGADQDEILCRLGEKFPDFA